MANDTRTRMLQATGRLLRQRGYHGTSLNDILADSGAPRGSLYFLFPGGKEELAAAAIALGGDMAGKDNWVQFARKVAPYVKILIPYAYGGLGACAFLLRTAHNHIAERSFDVRRKPEYLNRILLGMVSGGAIVLLVSTDSDDDTVRISAAALGFIAGYSNDFLFNAIERVVAAVLPRVGLDSLKEEAVAAAPAPLELPTGGMTLKEIMDRMENAKPEDKELYKSLLIKLRDRL